jgi:hypothetical protein
MSNPNIKNYGFGTRPKEVDDEVRRLGQEAIQANKGKPRVWTDEKIAEFVDEMLTIYKKILMDDKKIEEGKPGRLKQETVRDMNTMLNKLFMFKEKYYPTITKNINVNVEMTSDNVIERLKSWKRQEQVFEIVKQDIKNIEVKE